MLSRFVALSVSLILNVSLLQAVLQKMYTFSLEPNSTANAAEAALFRSILQSRNTPAAVFGWPSTHEGAGTTAVSKAGCYVMCAAAENLSLFASVLSKAVRLPAAAVLRTLNASKNYITFQTSECSIDCLG